MQVPSLHWLYCQNFPCLAKKQRHQYQSISRSVTETLQCKRGLNTHTSIDSTRTNTELAYLIYNLSTLREDISCEAGSCENYEKLMKNAAKFQSSYADNKPSIYNVLTIKLYINIQSKAMHVFAAICLSDFKLLGDKMVQLTLEKKSAIQ